MMTGLQAQFLPETLETISVLIVSKVSIQIQGKR
jgi:hypothetical protein